MSSSTWKFPETTGGLVPDYPFEWLPHDYFDPPDFRCERCIHYEGGCECDLNIFIYAVDIDMSQCWGFREGKVCRHCGKRT